MKDRDRMRWVWWLTLGLACGPSGGQHEESQSAGGTSVTSKGPGGSEGPGAPDTGTSMGSAATASSDTTGSSSAGDSSVDESSTGAWVDPACPDVHEGTLYINAMTDVETLRFTGRVNGNLVVEDFEGENLEFLHCLHVVEWGVLIRKNQDLATLAGLNSLSHVGFNLVVRDNPALTSVADLESLTVLAGLGVWGNASLTSLDLPHIEKLDALGIGDCGFSFNPGVDNPSLQTLDGLTGLTTIGEVIIGSQSSLSSIARLHEVAAAGGFSVHDSHITNNPSLPFGDVELLMQLADEHTVFHCGNLAEPETNECYCPMPR